MPSPKLIFVTLAGTLFYMGIAVLGWGGFSAFFSHPARTAATVAIFAMAVAALFSGGNMSTGEREDRGNRWVLAAFGVIGLLSAYLPAYTDRMEFWTFGGDAVRWIGVGVLAIGGVVRILPTYILGNRFSGLVAIQPGHRLVTNGIYGVIRHPSYLGLMLYSVGWALVFRSGVGLLLVALMVPPLLARIRSEETLLRAHFGGEHEQYRARTWRMIPGVY
jgi:protein-S-isoprenylcysteine O-methyltransferase Ste14